MVNTRPQNLEGYLHMLVGNLSESVGQIDSKKYPEYDANTRRNIREELNSIVKARKEQKSLDANYPTPKLSVSGLRLRHLPKETTLGELRQIRRYVKLGA